MGRTHGSLLSSTAQWLPFQDLLIRYLQNPNVFNPQVEVPPRTYRLLLPNAIEKRTQFYRLVNSSTDDASSVARRNSVFPWTGATRMAARDETSYLWEYQIPQVLHDRPQAFLEHPDTEVQWLDLTDHEKLYIVLQAKPNKGKEGIQDIKSPEDLAVELAAAMDKDWDDGVPLPRPPFLTQVFPTHCDTCQRESCLRGGARAMAEQPIGAEEVNDGSACEIWSVGGRDRGRPATGSKGTGSGWAGAGYRAFWIVRGHRTQICSAVWSLHHSLDSRGIPHIGTQRIRGSGVAEKRAL